jgi:hypothetical protein
VSRTGQADEQLCFAEGAPIALTNLSNFESISQIRIQSTSATTNANAGLVTLSGDSGLGQEIKVLVRRTTDGGFEDNPLITLPAALANWSGLDASGVTGATVRLTGAISGNLTGPITCGKIVRLQVGGDINGTTATPATITVSATGDASQRVIADELGPDASLIATTGNLGGVFARRVRGTIEAPEGSITFVSAADDITIASPGGVIAKHGIGAITVVNAAGPTPVYGAVNANITANLGRRTPRRTLDRGGRRGQWIS